MLSLANPDTCVSCCRVGIVCTRPMRFEIFMNRRARLWVVISSFWLALVGALGTTYWVVEGKSPLLAPKLYEWSAASCPAPRPQNLRPLTDEEAERFQPLTDEERNSLEQACRQQIQLRYGIGATLLAIGPPVALGLLLIAISWVFGRRRPERS
jgi:hypothetical protein